MRILPAVGDVANLDVEALVVGYSEDGGMTGPAGRANEATQGLLARLVESRDITGKCGDTSLLLEPPGVRARSILVVGLGKQAALDRGTVFRAAGAAARQLARRQRGRVAFCLGDLWTIELVESAITGAVTGCQGQDLYRSEKKYFPFAEMLWLGASNDACQRGQILGDSVNLARRLVNQPPNVMFPQAFAEAALETCRDCGIECEVWDEQRLERERCGALLAVGRASTQPPRLVIMRYRGSRDEQAPLALVGKGVTFDSGGLSIKPSDGMKTMKCDMAGAATVLAAMQAIARLKLPVHVLGFAGLVENVISGAAFKLGDVLTARSGKTIEVLNTDAEGRLVLADVLDLAVERGAAAIIDLATLTGACVVALGTNVAGLMSNHQPWCDRVAAAARTCGEPAWQLPMFAEFGEQIRSSVADLKNVGEGRYGGAITAAKFLEEFVAGKPWTHLDIAGPSFSDSSRAWMDGGGTGAFVRTVVEVARGWSGTAEVAMLPS